MHLHFEVSRQDFQLCFLGLQYNRTHHMHLFMTYFYFPTVAYEVYYFAF